MSDNISRLKLFVDELKSRARTLAGEADDMRLQASMKEAFSFELAGQADNLNEIIKAMEEIIT